MCCNPNFLTFTAFPATPPTPHVTAVPTSCPFAPSAVQLVTSHQPFILLTYSNYPWIRVILKLSPVPSLLYSLTPANPAKTSQNSVGPPDKILCFPPSILTSSLFPGARLAAPALTNPPAQHPSVSSARCQGMLPALVWDWMGRAPYLPLCH